MVPPPISCLLLRYRGETGKAVAAAPLVLRAALHADDGVLGGVDGGVEGRQGRGDAAAAEDAGGDRGRRGLSTAAHLPLAPGGSEVTGGADRMTNGVESRMVYRVEE